MALEIPRHIATADIQERSIRFEWDDWGLEKAEGPIDDALYSRLLNISQRANVAFTIGCAEWILFRFQPLVSDATPWQHVEASWAQIIDPLYSFRWELTDEDEWTGPVKGPVRRAMELVADGFAEMTTDADPSLCAATISRLAEHVITISGPFQEWRDLIVERLERLYPRDPEEPIGEVVPRVALDPHYAFEPRDTEALVNSYLRRLDYTRNPFLHSPAEMLEEGFDGVPYHFDIEQDRRARIEW